MERELWFSHKEKNSKNVGHFMCTYVFVEKVMCRRDMRLPVCDLVNTFFDRTGR